MKDNALINFSNAEFGKIRAMIIDGEPWFVGKDVAKALGYKKPENAVATHVPDKYKTTTLIQGTGSNYKSKTVLINEAGLYKLVMRSKLESAEKFSDWTCEEVLPSIRKTGSYSVQNDPRWLQTRQNTKLSHKPFTDAINLLIEYLSSRGQKFHDVNWIYGHLTNVIQNHCGVQRGQRDNTPVANLNKLDQVQSMVANIILKLIAGGRVKTLAEVEATIILQLDSLDRLLGGEMLMLSSSSVA